MNENVFFENVAERWFKEKQASVTLKKSSIISYKSMLQSIVIPYWKKFKVTEIKQYDLEKFAENLKKQGFSEITISNYVTFTRMIIRYGMEFAEMEEVARKTKKRYVETLTSTEQKKFINFLKNNISEKAEYLGFMIILYTGISISEVAGLRWEDINLENKSIFIERRVSRENSGINVENLTNARYVYFSSQLSKILEKVKKDSKKYVLSGNDNHIVESRVLQYKLKDICKILEMKNVTCMMLRDTFVVNAIKKGISPVVIANMIDIALDSFFYKYGELINITETEKKLELQKLIY